MSSSEDVPVAPITRYLRPLAPAARDVYVVVCGLDDSVRDCGTARCVSKHSATPPKELRDYLIQLARGEDPATCAAELFDDEPVNIPSILSPYTGSSEMLRFASEDVARFIAQLFLDVAEAAGLQLCGWDLYHGHLVAFDCAEAGAAELGLLFHAREHPQEFSARSGRVLPVCSDEAGGERDPRRGTRYSISDADYPDRNFLWLLSRNSTWLLNARSPACHALMSSGCKRFFTVNEDMFGTQLGTVCFFPRAMQGSVVHATYDPAEPRPIEGNALLEGAPKDVLAHPVHGFPLDWHVWREREKRLTTGFDSALRDLLTSDTELLRRLTNGDTCDSGTNKRRQRLGTAEERAELIQLAEAESARRQAESEAIAVKRTEAARAELLAKGATAEDADSALALSSGSAYRSWALLRVAFWKYRSSEEEHVAGDRRHDFGLDVAQHALYGISSWLGGEPSLALEALAMCDRVSGLALEEAVESIANRQKASFERMCSERLDRACAEGGFLVQSSHITGSGPKQ